MHIPKIGGKEREKGRKKQGGSRSNAVVISRARTLPVCVCASIGLCPATHNTSLSLSVPFSDDSPCPGPCLSSLAEDNRKKHPSSILSFSLGCVGTKGGKQSGQDKGENNGSQLDNSTGQYNNTGKQVRSARQRDKETTQYNTTPIVLHRL